MKRITKQGGEFRTMQEVVTVREWFRMNRAGPSYGTPGWDKPMDCILQALRRQAEIDQRLRQLASEELGGTFVRSIIGYAMFDHSPEYKQQQLVLQAALKERRCLEIERDGLMREAAKEILLIAAGRTEAPGGGDHLTLALLATCGTTFEPKKGT